MTELSPEKNRVPVDIRHIHLMGICGTGMAALAGMLQASGYTVSGSDSHVYPPMSTFLQDLDITVNDGYRAENLTPLPDLVIIGNVIRKSNPEAMAVAEEKLYYLSFPQALAHFFIQPRTSLVITGTHGKTTTCSLLASALYYAKMDPTFMIGGIVREFGANFRIGNGPFFIAEGDEYDTAFFDKESKFLHYRPQVAVITSIEFDHADIFNSIDDIMAAFRKFVRLLPTDGLLIANLDDPNVAKIASEAPCPVEGYGLSPSLAWSIREIEVQQGVTRFTVYKDGQEWHTMEVQLPGRHNCLNSLATVAVMHHLGISAQEMSIGLKRFAGVKRRQEIRGVEKSVTVIDDFAHHPTAVAETLAALKNSYSGKRLVAVFEPRTNSSRRSIFQENYVNSFDAADLVLLREPVPIDGLSDHELFSSKKLAKDLINRKKVQARAFASTDEILEALRFELRADDVVAILSNGGFDNIHLRLLDQLKYNQLEAH